MSVPPIRFVDRRYRAAPAPIDQLSEVQFQVPQHQPRCRLGQRDIPVTPRRRPARSRRGDGTAPVAARPARCPAPCRCRHGAVRTPRPEADPGRAPPGPVTAAAPAADSGRAPPRPRRCHCRRARAARPKRCHCRRAARRPAQLRHCAVADPGRAPPGAGDGTAPGADPGRAPPGAVPMPKPRRAATAPVADTGRAAPGSCRTDADSKPKPLPPTAPCRHRTRRRHRPRGACSSTSDRRRFRPRVASVPASEPSPAPIPAWRIDRTLTLDNSQYPIAAEECP